MAQEITAARHGGEFERERGRFGDGIDQFTVRTAPGRWPDSLKVYTAAGALVMVITGIGSAGVGVTWAEPWRAFSGAWKSRMHLEAFRIYYDCHGAGCPAIKATALANAAN